MYDTKTVKSQNDSDKESKDVSEEKLDLAGLIGSVVCCAIVYIALKILFKGDGDLATMKAGAVLLFVGPFALFFGWMVGRLAVEMCRGWVGRKGRKLDPNG